LTSFVTSLLADKISLSLTPLSMHTPVNTLNTYKYAWYGMVIHTLVKYIILLKY